MKYLVGFFAWILIASAWPMTTQQIQAAQVDKPQPADIRINHDVHVENWRVLDIFLYLLRGTGLRGGFVEIAGCSDLPPKGSLQIEQGTTLREAMNALVLANPGYKWDLEDGVINLMPRRGAPLLRTRIAKFQLKTTDWELPIALGDLLTLPEVRGREAALGLSQGSGQGGPTAIPKHRVPRQPMPVQINLKNLSLQNAFNEIAKASPKAVWIYRETDCKGSKRFILDMDSSY